MSDISREDEIIGANVKKFRESQGISRKDLAHIFHISEDGVYRIERGETGVSSAYAYILANQLHCDMNFIYGLTTDPICLNMECMDKEQLTPENAISKIRWYTDMLEKVLRDDEIGYADGDKYHIGNGGYTYLCELFIWKEVLF